MFAWVVGEMNQAEMKHGPARSTSILLGQSIPLELVDICIVTSWLSH
jgi:hypothetical protein